MKDRRKRDTNAVAGEMDVTTGIYAVGADRSQDALECHPLLRSPSFHSYCLKMPTVGETSTVGIADIIFGEAGLHHDVAPASG